MNIYLYLSCYISHGLNLILLHILCIHRFIYFQVNYFTKFCFLLKSFIDYFRWGSKILWDQSKWLNINSNYVCIFLKYLCVLCDAITLTQTSASTSKLLILPMSIGLLSRVFLRLIFMCCESDSSDCHSYSH